MRQKLTPAFVRDSAPPEKVDRIDDNRHRPVWAAVLDSRQGGGGDHWQRHAASRGVTS
jgi:hypothetical protein